MMENGPPICGPWPRANLSAVYARSWPNWQTNSRNLADSLTIRPHMATHGQGPTPHPPPGTPPEPPPDPLRPPPMTDPPAPIPIPRPERPPPIDDPPPSPAA